MSWSMFSKTVEKMGPVMFSSFQLFCECGSANKIENRQGLAGDTFSYSLYIVSGLYEMK